jgi:AhpD family alkylhydroperoxidase
LFALTAQAQNHKLTSEEARAKIKADFGFVPNLLVEMSKSPVTPLIYVESDKMMHDAYLTQKEQQVVQLATSVYNHCVYCTSMHSKFSELNGVSHEDVLAIRKGKELQDKHLNNLVWITNTILEKRGHLNEKDLAKIEEMNIDRARLYEILVHVGRKTIVNYAAHIIQPEIDEQFKFVE